VLSYMLLLGEAPFSHPNRFLLAAQIRKFSGFEAARLASLSPGAKQFICALIAPIETRLSAEQLSAHP
jgi:hypothetical protein